MCGREALVHLRAELAAQAIHPLERRRHAFGHTADIMPEILGDEVEMTASFERRRLQLLAQLTDLLSESPEGLIEVGSAFFEVGAGFVIHADSLAARPRQVQVWQSGYTACRHMWATASISTSAPAGSLAAWMVERAGGCFPAWRAYTSFISAKSSMRARNTVVLTR